MAKKMKLWGSFQSDWNQNDPSQPDYVKNRTHWIGVSTEYVSVFESKTVDFTNAQLNTNGKWQWVSILPSGFAIGDTVRVIWNGKEYDCVVRGDDVKCARIGNEWLSEVDGENTGEPFLFVLNIVNTMMYVTQDEGSATFEILTLQEVEKVHKLDPKYLHGADWNQNDPTAPDYVKNRTHYDSRATETVNITFDGVLDGKEHYFVEEGVDAGEGYKYYIVKISNLTPSMEEVIGGTVAMLTNGEPIGTPEITESDIEIWDDTSFWFHGITVCTEDCIIDGFSFTKGIWVYYNIEGEDVNTIGSLSYPKEVGELKKIDPKYLPDGIIEYESGPSQATFAFLYRGTTEIVTKEKFLADFKSGTPILVYASDKVGHVYGYQETSSEFRVYYFAGENIGQDTRFT